MSDARFEGPRDPATDSGPGRSVDPAGRAAQDVARLFDRPTLHHLVSLARDAQSPGADPLLPDRPARAS